MTQSIGRRHTGHLSPLALSILAQVRQHAMCPVPPCTMVEFLSSVRQMRQVSVRLAPSIPPPILPPATPAPIPDPAPPPGPMVPNEGGFAPPMYPPRNRVGTAAIEDDGTAGFGPPCNPPDSSPAAISDSSSGIDDSSAADSVRRKRRADTVAARWLPCRPPSCPGPPGEELADTASSRAALSCAAMSSSMTALLSLMCHAPASSGSYSPSRPTNSTTVSSLGGARFRRTDTHPLPPARRSRSTHWSMGCSDKALPTTVRIDPHGA
mmetsp:Transcript_30441/g.90882  ORF Transcript_30441/g.90882 Transcript_30441/m.90882 type:complete len:266 (+) Transcript_30441:395-1192(+)